MDSKTIRKRNLLALLGRHGTLAKLESLTGVSASYLSQIKNGTRLMGDATARQIEKGVSKNSGWMDQPHNKDDTSAMLNDPNTPGPTQEFLKHWFALPEGLREHLTRQANRLHNYSAKLPPFARSQIAPPTDPASYEEWQSALEADIARLTKEPVSVAKLKVVKKA